MINTFHFVQPLWLLALIPLAALLWQLSFSSTSSKAWEKVIDANLLPLLLQGEDKVSGRSLKWLLGLGWFIGIIALADPVWEKIPKPVFQTNNARVIVLDLSNSMLADDLKPSRLARARFKIEDILSKNEEGQVGLVVFAGDAFVAAPLTRDSDTIRSLLQVLTPQIMPSQGSRVDLGLLKAHTLLKQAGVNNEHVLLIADSVSNIDNALEASQKLSENGHTVSVLGVGTEAGAELRFAGGKQVKVVLEEDKLRKIAHKGAGRYHQIRGNNSDLNAVISTLENTNSQEQAKNDELKSNQWKSTGPYLILLLLPLAALAFRKGWLLNIFIFISIFGIFQPQSIQAAPSLSLPSTPSSFSETWQSLWKNKEQRADIALQKQQYDKARQLTQNTDRLGSALFKNGNYSDALSNFKKSHNADARYNEGNTLAALKKYKEAIAAYDQALKLQPDMKDALFNKKAIEVFLKKQKKQNKDSKDSKKNSKDKNKKSDKENKGDGKNKESQDNKDSSDKNKDQNNKKGKDGKKEKNKNQFDDANKALKKEKKEKAKKDEPDEANNKQSEKKSNKLKPQKNKAESKEEAKGTKAEAEKLTKEEKMAAEQWLRRIPDDPGGLLRRKFLRQYRQRTQPSNNTENPW